MARKRINEVTVTKDEFGRLVLTNESQLAGNGQPYKTICASGKSVKSAITRWTRAFGRLHFSFVGVESERLAQEFASLSISQG